MGFIVGGVWGIASLVLLALGPLAERFGLAIILIFTPIGYCFSAIIGIWIIGKNQNESKSTLEKNNEFNQI